MDARHRSARASGTGHESPGRYEPGLMLDAGVRVNVIPSEAHGNLNIRLMPGDSIHDIIAQLTKTVADPQISFDIAPDSGENAPASSLDSPLYKTIEKVAPQDFPGAIVVPELSTGATD